ncbi:Gfo/Idh/MocA family protein [Pseudonocardia thermophila]|jgi:Predicted dehydrogenases and related proteins|uniref:Gfo/Idh/MocA family protein n=1 Tax=Pseudonocardia thermophila TaxID=1848 RepID=UPI00248F1E10|nr:Gfo/Idh/MocA family oxidoreductase [Pseudonocardia thermophila]
MSTSDPIRVGVIGTGMIGREHALRLARRTVGAQVVAVADTDAERARAVATEIGAEVYRSGVDLIDDVDAVVVASWGPTHEEYVLAAIAAGRPVFCEKPLAPTRAECDRILDAEVAAGRRLVTVGFMRRHDPQYVAMKEVVAGGSIGAPLLMHAAHRNVSVPDFFTSEMIVTDTAVHDIDVARWMFDEEIVAVTVLTGRVSRKAKPGFRDPQLIILETESGILVDVEASVNAGFAYDIRGEVVGEDGTVELSESAGAIVKRAGAAHTSVPTAWIERFAVAFDAEFRAWIDVVAAGGTHLSAGPTAWDGYAATACCEAGLESLRTGTRQPVELRPQPALYSTNASTTPTEGIPR